MTQFNRPIDPAGIKRNRRISALGRTVSIVNLGIGLIILLFGIYLTTAGNLDPQWSPRISPGSMLVFVGCMYSSISMVAAGRLKIAGLFGVAGLALALWMFVRVFK